MSWIWLGGAILISLVVGAAIGGRFGSAAEGLDELHRSSAIDRRLALSTLRRELANFMVRLDPDRFLRLYREARAADISIGASDKPTQSAQFAALCKQFPYYTDFDLLRTREHVLYADALSSHTLEEIEAHYMHIVNYHALQCALDEEWNHHGSATSETDLDHLESYVPKIKDTRFKKRFRSAVAEFYARRSEDTKGRIAYETEALVVYSVFHFSEIRWGFYFKDTNEYGLYGLFVAHEGDREFESFYRSDRDFEAEEYLHDLVTDYEI